MILKQPLQNYHVSYSLHFYFHNIQFQMRFSQVLDKWITWYISCLLITPAIDKWCNWPIIMLPHQLECRATGPHLVTVYRHIAKHVVMLSMNINHLTGSHNFTIIMSHFWHNENITPLQCAMVVAYRKEPGRNITLSECQLGFCGLASAGSVLNLRCHES